MSILADSNDYLMSAIFTQRIGGYHGETDLEAEDETIHNCGQCLLVRSAG